MSWLVSQKEVGGCINILPINDTDTHKECTACKCNPKVQFKKDVMIITHTSFDNREVVEQLIFSAWKSLN